jgi:hypothetical protein
VKKLNNRNRTAIIAGLATGLFTLIDIIITTGQTDGQYFWLMTLLISTWVGTCFWGIAELTIGIITVYGNREDIKNDNLRSTWCLSFSSTMILVIPCGLISPLTNIFCMQILGIVTISPWEYVSASADYYVDPIQVLLTQAILLATLFAVIGWTLRLSSKKLRFFLAE